MKMRKGFQRKIFSERTPPMCRGFSGKGIFHNGPVNRPSRKATPYGSCRFSF
ncbi:hypothetical cytosolic protein [Syntrophus aciditrophicus SB]|uniref:Hypothetical cytosolic protein n=1 Tax=Syntrophus aciditrophicus (strain SB) TaxID=56780 RepID=Q2LWJ6_SYNAS|nr:hypothetical cytosolic protein [Syntrophus aciditrophicus SB]